MVICCDQLNPRGIKINAQIMVPDRALDGVILVHFSSYETITIEINVLSIITFLFWRKCSFFLFLLFFTHFTNNTRVSFTLCTSCKTISNGSTLPCFTVIFEIVQEFHIVLKYMSNETHLTLFNKTNWFRIWD